MEAKIRDKLDFRTFVIYGYAYKTYQVLKNLKVTFKFGSLYQLRKLMEKDVDITRPENLAPYVAYINDEKCTLEDLNKLPEPVFRKITYLFSEFLKELLMVVMQPPKDEKIDFAEVLLFLYPRFLAEYRDSGFDATKFTIEISLISLAATYLKQIIFMSNVIPLTEKEHAFKLIRDFQAMLFPHESKLSEQELLKRIEAWERELKGGAKKEEA